MLLKRKELYEFSRFRLDVSERLLLRGEKRVPLADKAFETLCILVRRSGELVAKDELISEVWADVIVEENNLDQKISMLRHALGEQRGGKGREKFIETVRGRGYRFLPEVRAIDPEAAESDVHTSKKIEREQPPRPLVSSEGRPAGNVIALAAKIQDAALDERPQRAVESSAQELRREPSLAPGIIERPHSRKRPLWIAATAILVICSASILVWRFAIDRPQAVTAIDSIVVMPFENAARSAGTEYLGEGIAESVVNNLSQLSDLKVISGSAVRADTGQALDLRSIGSDLNVHAVLSGSIKQIGGQLVINARLDDARDSHRIWGEQYVGSITDIFDMQSDIARKVSSNLHSKLAAADSPLIVRTDTRNAEAYQLYLQGLYHWNKRTAPDIRRSAELFQQAIDQDPSYAKAYAWLGFAYLVLPSYTKKLTPDELKDVLQKRYAATQRAQELDSSLAEVHALLAAKHEDAFEFSAAEAEYRKTFELNPNLAMARSGYSLFLSWQGRSEEAMAEINKARELEPFSPSIAFNVGCRFADARRFDDAIAQYKRVLETEPNHPLTHLVLAQAYDRTARYGEAIEEYRVADVLLEKASANDASERAIALTAALKRDGANGYWQQRLVFGEQDLNKKVGSAYDIAVIYARLGQRERAFDYLERSFAAREFDIAWCKIEPAFDGLKSDPRFSDLLRRIGLSSSA
ncbi:MAG TPA: winged helix-turn-helix domain-containing protein [Pyrinomonadaceae bacterium]|nr:winged helix-turn-helix domain-containing protein [Pyrinomonadaceae bacterium]